MAVYINMEWHEKNPMPERPSRGQRLEWHMEHAKKCGCLAIPPSLQEEIKKRKGKHD